MAALSAEYQWIADLIQEEGRVVTLKKLTGGATDPAKPWRGDSAATDVPDITSDAVLVAYKAKEIDGSHVLRGDLKAFCAPHLTANLILYDFLVDTNGDGRKWRIVKSDKIEPGSEILLYILQLRR
jgi:hypothetical protein